MATIRFQTMKVGTISETSDVNSGRNTQINVKATIIINEGQGAVSGNYNQLAHNKSIIIDVRNKDTV
ncbi:MAG: hypothetical protein ACK4M9_05885 [Anaerobacillus sp.]|uniref:hypothetical protein n=1 Tax=Anaerobacillus sp. TaxID=1872506 RepID=UPI00391B3396